MKLFLARHSQTKENQQGIIQDRLLRERGYGVFQGRKVTRKDWAELPGTFFTNKPQRGESLQDVWRRQQKFWKKMKKKHWNEAILIVGHDEQLRILRGLFGNQNLKQAYGTDAFKHTTITHIST